MTAEEIEADLLRAFLATSKGTLEERGAAWRKFVEAIAARPKEVVEQMEKEKGLK